VSKKHKSRNIFVEAVPNLPMEEQPTELVERKGVGHPDSICDAIMDGVSVELHYALYPDRPACARRGHGLETDGTPRVNALGICFCGRSDPDRQCSARCASLDGEMRRGTRRLTPKNIYQAWRCGNLLIMRVWRYEADRHSHRRRGAEASRAH